MGEQNADLSEMEKLLYVVLGDDQAIDEAEKHSNSKAIIAYVTSEEGLAFFVQSYSSFTELFTKQTAIEIITSWLKTRFDSIPVGLYPEIQELIFDTALQNLGPEEGSLRMKIIEAQGFFLVAVFPSINDSIWEYVFSREDTTVSSILVAYTSALKYITPHRFSLITEVRKAIEDCGVLNKILYIAGQLMLQQNPEGYLILLNLSHWIPVINILNTFDGQLVNGYKELETAGYVLLILKNIILRIPTKDIRNQVITNWVEPLRLYKLCTSANEQPFVLESAASLLNGITTVIDTEFPLGTYFPTACGLIQSDSEAAFIMLPFLLTYNRIYAESYPIMFSYVYKRIVLFFSSPQGASDQFEEASVNLNHLLSTALKQMSKEDAIRLINNYQEDITLQSDISEVSAFLFVLNYCLSVTNSETFAECIPLLLSMAELPAPLTKQQITAVTIAASALSQCTSFKDLNAGPIFTLILNTMCKQKLDSKSYQLLHHSLVNISQKLVTKLKITPKHFEFLFSQMKPEFLEVAALLIPPITNPNRSVILSACFETIASGTLDILSSLAFISNLSINAKEPIYSVATNALIQLAQSVPKTDKAIAVFIKALLQIFKVEAFTFLTSIIPEINGPESLLSISENLMNATLVGSEENRKQAEEFLIQLADIVFQFYELGILLESQEEIGKQIVIKHLQAIYRIGTNFEQEQVMHLLAFMVSQLDAGVKDPVVMRTIFSAVNIFVEKNIEYILSEIVPYSYTFLLAPNYEATDAEWVNAERKLNILHASLKKRTEGFDEVLKNAMTLVGIEDFNMKEYNKYDDFSKQVKDDYKIVLFQKMRLISIANGF